MNPQRLIYRTYRSLKNRLQKKEGIPTFLFFKLLRIAEFFLSENRRVSPLSELRWASFYRNKYQGRPLYFLGTNHPVALTTIDHQIPRGAIRDSTKHPNFNKALRKLFSGRKFCLLDLGCAGGGLVRSFLQEGLEAVGIEGSDHPRRMGLGEWNRCPLHLFTCDITEPFQLKLPSNKIVLFDVITAWEVLEHIPEDRLLRLISNVVHHLKPRGYFIASVDQTPDIDPLTGAVYHQTLKPKSWWLAQFRKHGLHELQGHPFRTQDFARGNAIGIKDWDPDAGDGFHLVLQLGYSHA